jgi:hypothetical protein
MLGISEAATGPPYILLVRPWLVMQHRSWWFCQGHGHGCHSVKGLFLVWHVLGHVTQGSGGEVGVEKSMVDDGERD